MSTSSVNAPRHRLGLGLALLAGLLSLLPFLALCWYAHPSADDFLTANDVRRHGHWGYIPFMYLQWTGRYTATVLWGLLNPVAYGYTTEGYGLVCLLLLLALPLNLYALLRALLPGQLSRLQSAAAAGLLSGLFLWQMPSPAEGWYWITSGYNYLLPALLTVLGLAALARRLHAPTPAGRRRWLLLAGALFVLSIGGNETNAVVLALTAGSFTVWHSLRQRRIEWQWVALTAALALACAAAFLAPGNFVRLGGAHPLLLPEAAARAGLSAYRQLINWLGNGSLLVITVLMAPVAARLARHPDLPLNRLAQYPLLLTLLIPLSLYLAMLLPWLSTGLPSPARARNVLYLFFLLSWLLTAYAWYRCALLRRPTATGRLPRLLRLALWGGLLLVFALGHTRHLRGRDEADNRNNILVAYQDWLDGSAARYDAELRARYQALRTPGWLDSEPTLPPLDRPARTLLFYDITADPNDWSNQAYAEFFGKKSLRVGSATQ